MKSMDGFPVIDGTLSVDQESRRRAARDFGNIVHREPLGIVRPASVSDVVETVRFARANRIPIAVRGCGHSTNGQAQTSDGIVVDMSSLCAVRSLNDREAWVDGGCTWAALVERGARRSVEPAILTDYLHLSVGGTLSMGGIGGASFAHGIQTDMVSELEVVTGTGDLALCSASRNRELFDAVRGGLGRSGIITAARVPLVPVSPCVRAYELRYDTLSAFLADHVRLAESRRFDYLDGTIVAEESAATSYVLTAAKRYRDGEEPDDAGLLEGLVCSRWGASDRKPLEFAFRVDDYVARLKQLGLWQAPHPWLDLFLPASRTEAFIERASTELCGVRDGMILTYVVYASSCQTPLLRLPQEDAVFLVDVLRNAWPPTPERSASLLAANTELCRWAAALGATIYPIGCIPLDVEICRGLHWSMDGTSSVRERFDPDRVFAKGDLASVAQADRG